MKKNISDFFDWVIKEESKKIVEEELEEMLVLGWTFGYDIIPDNLRNILDKASKPAKIKGL